MPRYVTPTMWCLAVGVAVNVAVIHGAQLRNSEKTVALGSHGAEKPADKVKHLVLDIEESVRKAGEDAEMVFATLYTYDGQLENSLKHEIGTLNQTLAKLLAMQATYSADLSKTHSKLQHLGATAQGSTAMASKYSAGTAHTRGKFDNLEENVKMLVALLHSAGVTPQGKLVTPETPDARGEPARVFAAIRRLLGANPALRSQYAAVYNAFLPQLRSRTVHPVVQMTPNLLRETIGALTSVQKRLFGMKAEALLQFDSLHRRFEKEAVVAGASAQAQQGLEAENEQKAQELMFSIKFTKSVLKIDQQFYNMVSEHVKSNADLIYGIRDLRQAQLKILRDLTGILGAEGAIASGALSFLAVASKSSHEHKETNSQESESGLQREIETTIQNGGDTHAILMRVQAQLDESQPIDASSVRSTMVEMQNALQSVENDQSKFEEAKRGCESQKFHANEEEQGLKANLALMSAARDHAEKAIKAAETNVRGIEKKDQALQKSSTDFTRISVQALKSLEGQSHDRKTIMMAVKKAAEVVGPTLPAGVSTVELMQSLLQDLQAQEAKEQAYRNQQDAFRAEFMHYVQDYTQLLGERRRHYESTLGVLELHVSELASDLLAQQQTLSTGSELRKQSEGLCESVLKFYEKHTKQRAELSKTLRSILPNMPTVLSAGAIESADLN
jgi:hypothetical protein